MKLSPKRYLAALAVGLLTLASVATFAVANAPLAHADPIVTSPDGTALAVTPSMGYNNWASEGCTGGVPYAGNHGPTEALILSQAKAMVDSGLRDAGYDTVTIDDCWMTHERDASGNLQADLTKFPNGMKYIGDQLHAMGMKYGIYQDIGTTTCGGYPGSYGHHAADANLFASWGVDFVKLDGCNMPAEANSKAGYIEQYAAFGQALKASGRNMVYSVSSPAYFFIGFSKDNLSDWYDVIDSASTQGQLWRTGYDVSMNGGPTNGWYTAGQNGAGVLGQYEYNSKLARYSAPGSWNDPDFLRTGEGLSPEESRSQMALWSMMASPLILSIDVTKLSAENLATLKNPTLIAINQDALGKQAGIVAQDGTKDMLARPLANGDRAVSVLNRGDSPLTTTVTLPSIGLLGKGCTVDTLDAWTGAKTAGVTTLNVTVPAHGTAVLRLTPAAACGDAVPTGQFTGLADKCLDVHNFGTTDGTPVELHACNAGVNQSWSLHTDGTVRSMGRCLDVPPGAEFAVLNGCSGAETQKWQYARNGNLQNVGHDLACLSIYRSETANATPAGLFRCGDVVKNQPNQMYAAPV